MSLCTRTALTETIDLQANSTGSAGAAPNSPDQVNTNTSSPVGTLQEGPFDFRSPVQTGRPQVPQAQQPEQQGAAGSQYGTAPFWNADVLVGERNIHTQTDPQEESEEDKEKHMRCGRALLERAMLGPPLPEGDAPICSSGMTCPVNLTMLGKVTSTRSKESSCQGARGWQRILFIYSPAGCICCAQLLSGLHNSVCTQGSMFQQFMTINMLFPAMVNAACFLAQQTYNLLCDQFSLVAHRQACCVFSAIKAGPLCKLISLY